MLKTIVYAEEPMTREDMKNRIRETCRHITSAVLRNVRRAFAVVSSVASNKTDVPSNI